MELLKWEQSKTTATFNSNPNCNSSINYNNYSNNVINTLTSYANLNYKPP